ncbi:MAG: hypothetical protein ACRC34_02055 [Cetobacterium sp.]
MEREHNNKYEHVVTFRIPQRLFYILSEKSKTEKKSRSSIIVELLKVGL